MTAKTAGDAGAPEAGTYTASSIDVLEGLEAVRVRPGMYIGSTGPRGLHHLGYEIVDNSVDEALAGYCTRIDVTINEDNSITVEDNGRGIPTGIVEKTGKSGVETVFTVLHAGGKFGGGGYKVSGGLHGVGASVVNALSTELIAEIARGNALYRQVYKRGVAEGDIEKVRGAKPEHTGTKVRWMPDPDIFETLDYEFDTIAARFREQAYLTKGVWIQFIDLRG